MKICPNCSNHSIPVIGLSISRPVAPIRCRFCNELFYLPGIYREPLSLLFNILIPVVLIASILIPSWWPLVAYVIGFPLLFVLSSAMCTPKHTNQALVQKSRHYRNVIVLILLTLVIVALAYEYL